MGTLPESAVLPEGATAAPTARPHWLTAERLTVYPLIVLAVSLISAIGWIVASGGMVDPRGKPLGYDFITFWGASYLALGGTPAAAYDMVRIAAAEQAAVPGLETVYLWHYPPTFFLLILPLSLLPYLAAYFAFLGTTGAAFVAVMRRLLATTIGLDAGGVDRRAMILVAAFPAVFVNLFHGQNGFLTTAILGAALLALDRRPWLGGALFGLMAYKPQFAILVPVALLAWAAAGDRRAWHAMAAAAVVALAFAGISTAVMGSDVLAAFIANGPFVRRLMEGGFLPWNKMPTVFAMLRLVGVSVGAAYAAQAVCALAAIAGVVAVWRSQAPLALRGAMLIVATMLATPYMFDYDMVVLALPLAWLAADGIARGWQQYEREILVAAWVAPLVAPNIAEATHLQLAPFVTIGLFILILQRSVALARQPA
jgi:hypothetical protein